VFDFTEAGPVVSEASLCTFCRLMAAEELVNIGSVVEDSKTMYNAHAWKWTSDLNAR